MIVERFVLGILDTNAYIATDDETGSAVVIDPATDGEEFISRVKEKKGDICAILVTHRHFDHLLGLHCVAEITGAKIYMHALDAQGALDREICLLSDNPGQTPFLPTKVDVMLNEGDVITFGHSSLETVHTPGHTSGSVCFVSDDTMFSGDTLFRIGVGATHFPTGSLHDLRSSLLKLGRIFGDRKVYPGHGDTTTLDYERLNNPMMRVIK